MAVLKCCLLLPVTQRDIEYQNLTCNNNECLNYMIPHHVMSVHKQWWWKVASHGTKYTAPLHCNLQHKILIDFVTTETNSNAPFGVRLLWQFWCSKRPVSRPTYFLKHQIWSKPVHGCAGRAQSVQRLPTGWINRGSNPSEIFRTPPDRPWGPSRPPVQEVPCLYLARKAAGAWCWPINPI
jgi:hypothetical protein